MEQVFYPALVVSSDPLILDNLRWAVGEFVDQVVIATSWSDAMGIAHRQQILVAVVDFDNVPAHARHMLVMALRTRAHATIIAVGTKQSDQNAANVGVTLVMEKPLNMPSLMSDLVRIVGGRHGDGEAVY